MSYDAIEEFKGRTREELADRGGVLFLRDTQPAALEAEYIRSKLTGHRRVLELGCGFGVWADAADKAGVDEYVGVDVVGERVAFAEDARASRAVRRARFVHGDARTYRGEEAAFDAVLLVTVIQHLPLPDAIAVLKTAAWHLAPGGEVVMLESLLLDESDEECARLYAERGVPHMVPKSSATLQAAVPELVWRKAGEQDDMWVLTKVLP